jgi:hypothetical protein
MPKTVHQNRIRKPAQASPVHREETKVEPVRLNGIARGIGEAGD